MMTLYSDPAQIVNAASTDYCRENRDDRGDEHFLHVGDLTECARAVWYRRNGQLPPAHDAATRNKFGRGLGIEEVQVRHLRWQFQRHGWLTFTQAILAYTVSDIGEVSARIIDSIDEARPDEIVGHIDFLALSGKEEKRAVVVEVKSRSFLGPAPLYKHTIQAASYGLGVALAMNGYEVETYIREVAAVSGEYSTHAVNYRDHAATITGRMLERRFSTNPGDEMPEPEPTPESYVEKKESRKKDAALIVINEACDKYCPFVQCPRYRENAVEAVA